MKNHLLNYKFIYNSSLAFLISSLRTSTHFSSFSFILTVHSAVRPAFSSISGTNKTLSTLAPLSFKSVVVQF